MPGATPRFRRHRCGPEVIRLSGCPNACGNHIIAALGFEGRARRHNGRLMPLYEVLADGHPEENHVKFGERLGAVPARLVPELVAEIYAKGLASVEVLRPWFSVSPGARPGAEISTSTWGQRAILAGRSRTGECGAGVLDVVRVDLEDAADALAEAQRSATGLAAVPMSTAPSPQPLAPCCRFLASKRARTRGVDAVSQH